MRLKILAHKTLNKLQTSALPVLPNRTIAERKLQEFASFPHRDKLPPARSEATLFLYPRACNNYSLPQCELVRSTHNKQHEIF